MDVYLASLLATEFSNLIFVFVKMDIMRLRRVYVQHAIQVVTLAVDLMPQIVYPVIHHKIDRTYQIIKHVNVISDTTKMQLLNFAVNVILFA